MDFSKFDSRSAAAAGGEMHVKHPVTGEPLMDGDKPCIVVVRGSESAEVQGILKSLERAKAKGDAGDDFQHLIATTKPLIIGFKNIAFNGRELTAADAELFLALQAPNGRAGEGEASFIEQVIDFATRRGNFLGNA